MSNMSNSISDFIPAANKYANLYAEKPHISAHYDRDDLVSEAFLALHKGEQAYLPDAGMKFSTYMIQRIKWRMMEIDRACAKKALKGDGIQMSLDAIKEDDNSDAWHPSYTEDKETLSMLDSLSERDRDIVLRHTIEGESYASIAEDYNVSGQSIHNWHKAAIQSLA